MPEGALATGWESEEIMFDRKIDFQPILYTGKSQTIRDRTSKYERWPSQKYEDKRSGRTERQRNFHENLEQMALALGSDTLPVDFAVQDGRQMFLDRGCIKMAENSDFICQLSNDQDGVVSEIKLSNFPRTGERQQGLSDALVARPTKPGPVASPGTHTVIVSEKEKTWTYAARFGASPTWKIGQTSDLEERLRDLNAHVPVEYLEEQWSIAWRQEWPSAERAKEMEQRVLTILDDKRTQGERVRCSEKELKKAWVEATLGLSNHITPRAVV